MRHKSLNIITTTYVARHTCSLVIIESHGSSFIVCLFIYVMLCLSYFSPLARITKYILSTPVGKRLKDLYNFVNGNVDNVNNRVKVRVKVVKKSVGKPALQHFFLKVFTLLVYP